MNLHGIVANAISAVNPLVALLVQVSTGYSTNADGSRTPAYANAVSVQGQVQSLTAGDLRQLDALNIQGAQRAVYLNGRIDGLIRPGKKGGDLIITPEGNTWLVVHILEYWPDWVKAAITLQIDTFTPGPPLPPENNWPAL
jgi:hypothetical protein